VRNRIGLIGFVLCLLVLAAAAASRPLIATHDPFAQSIRARLQGPSAEHWLGTDNFGRDLYSRILTATGPASGRRSAPSSWPRSSGARRASWRPTPAAGSTD
jgi:ABC-type antimicrobial peptide transport system permease subunit